MNFEQQLEGFEGRRNVAYQDTRGVWTIGIGHTGPEVHEGLTWTDAQVDATLAADVARATSSIAAICPWLARLNDARQAVLLGMTFQLGAHGVAGFKQALAAVRDERWAYASSCMLDSDWARQTPARARRLARQMESGEWQ